MSKYKSFRKAALLTLIAVITLIFTSPISSQMMNRGGSTLKSQTGKRIQRQAAASLLDTTITGIRAIDLISIDKNKDGKVFQCPMDLAVLSDTPGDCPTCGMSLREVTLETGRAKLVKMGIPVKPLTAQSTLNPTTSASTAPVPYPTGTLPKSVVREGTIDLNKIDENKDGKVFQDQMDWNVLSDKPGKCPLCKMTLKEVTIETARKNLLEYGFKVK